MNWDSEFKKIIHRLDQRGVMPVRIPSLIPTTDALKRIGFYNSDLYKNIKKHPQKCIVVAGTNGKGSVCATLERLLSANGVHVGLYTSPHLVEATERIRLDEKNISKKDFCHHYAEVIRKTEGLALSHFEMLTLIAVHYYMASTPEYLIFEVGMGGLWDATNAIPHGTSVITRIGIDHERYLGASSMEIATNKLGIIKRFEGLSDPMNVVHFPLPVECESLIEEKRNSVESRWKEVQTFPYKIAQEKYPVWMIEHDGKFFPLGLKGKRAVENMSIALRTLECLGFDSAKSLPHLKDVNWPGRMGALEYEGKTVFLSGDHNPQGIDSLVEILSHFRYKNLKILFGAGLDKNIDSMLPLLFKLPRVNLHFTVSPFKGVRDFGTHLTAAKWFETDPKVALARLCKEANKDDLILVTGSLYLVGEILQEILSAKGNR